MMMKQHAHAAGWSNGPERHLKKRKTGFFVRLNCTTDLRFPDGFEKQAQRLQPQRGAAVDGDLERVLARAPDRVGREAVSI